jgi:ClpP class serine protease
MTTRRIVALLPLCAALAAACGGGGDGGGRAAAVDTGATRKVWTPDQARALRQAREQGETRPAPIVRVPGPAEGEDSAQWAAEEKTKYDERVRAMQPYTDCMAQARAVRAEVRPTLEAACKRLPSAPR